MCDIYTLLYNFVLSDLFQTEVKYLGQLHHPNLVKLIGYCLEGENRLLVYEFMPKGSLENHLFRSNVFNVVEKFLYTILYSLYFYLMDI